MFNASINTVAQRLRVSVLLILLLLLTACGGGGGGGTDPIITADPINLYTWISGSNLRSQSGDYGTQGIAAGTNVPGARDAAMNWGDASGDLWLFGGNGYDSAGPDGFLNDLWRYQP